MMSWWTVAAAPFLGLGVGLYTMRYTAQLDYRQGRENDPPRPGIRRWIVAASAIGWLMAALGSTVTGRSWLPLLPLLICGPYLAAVDLDVRRLPDRVIFPAFMATLFCAVVLAIWARTWQPVAAAVCYAVGVGGFLWLLWRVSRGGLGFGDVKLGLLLGAALSTHTWRAPFLTLLLGNLVVLTGDVD